MRRFLERMPLFYMLMSLLALVSYLVTSDVTELVWATLFVLLSLYQRIDNELNKLKNKEEDSK